MNARANANVSMSVQERTLPWALPVLLLIGLAVRLPFLGDDGFKNDVQTFEAWAISLVDHGLANFYGKTSFADYPPGYFYILAVVGHIWQLFRAHDPGYDILKTLVKLPAVLADLGVGALVYAIGKRFASPLVALGASALYVLNPATIFISAKWGQVDAISGGLALLGAYCLLRSDDERLSSISWWIVGAWLSLGYSLLIKPQAAVLVPIFIAFAFTDAVRRRMRVQSTLVGIVVALALAVTLSEPFHPGNPIATMTWLIGRYAFGSNVYAFNSVNAFNLWAIRGQFWLPDSMPIGFVPQYIWGIVLVVAALVLIVWRYVQDRTPSALLESCAIALLAFFTLATRMHERYIFDGLLFTIACVPIARRYLWGTIALTVVLYANLVYSLQYLNAMLSQQPGIDAHNLWGVWTQILVAFEVATFFALGYAFLGAPVAEGGADVPVPNPARPAPRPAAIPVDQRPWNVANNWFRPAEGLTALRWPLDYVVMGALGLGNFILSFVNYWYPADKIFDEIYFARAAEEYLQNLRIYENTHPPLSKLLVTLSVMLFGGMPHGHGLGGWTGLNAIIGHMPDGDNSYGWRFLDVVAGAVVVMLLYLFAKRITGSTIFATVASLLLTFDGMHFVQSRIATPEGFVVCFSLLAVYAFYRFWIASQTEERAHVNAPSYALVVAVAVSLALGAGIAFLWKAIWHDLDAASITITTIYCGLGIYLLIRYKVFVWLFGDGRRELTFAEGSYTLQSKNATVVHAIDGGVLDTSTKNVQTGALSQQRAGNLVYEGGDVTITYRRDASVTYESPSGEATYAQNEIRANGFTEKGSSAKTWLLWFTVALGLLVSSKWYGVMGFSVSFVVLIGVWFQRAILAGRPALWGNPRGFRLDGALATILFVSATVYALAWTPDLVRHGQGDIQNFNDVVYRQYSMFEYHDTLKATHPYSSKWWEWPLDYVPIAYFYQDHRKNQAVDNSCCVQEITSMPNPFILWFGLICVPIVAYLAWRERNKGYALIVLTYLLQWLPWMKSPRITFAYHFYVDIPLICLCNAIVLQRIWEWGRKQGTSSGRWLGGGAVAAYVLLVGLAFVYFYPILAATPITHAAWEHRMWINKWIVGPG